MACLDIVIRLGENQRRTNCGRLLPEDISHLSSGTDTEIGVLVFSVAYNSVVLLNQQGYSNMNQGEKFDFESPATQMLQSLLESHVGKRPVVFIAHGAGGLNNWKQKTFLEQIACCSF